LIENPNPVGRRSGDKDLVAASLEIALDVLGENLFVLDHEDTEPHLLKLLSARDNTSAISARQWH